jgi:predicted membrane chloride channel (bestrophin family)
LRFHCGLCGDEEATLARREVSSRTREYTLDTGYSQREHMPLYCLDVISNFLHESHIAGNAPINLVALMDVNITELGLAVGRCEKIKNTSMPIAFVVHMRAFMLILFITLPLVLAKILGWATMLVCVLVVVAVLGIEGMAAEIENPFGYDCNDLPLDVQVLRCCGQRCARGARTIVES